MIETMDQARRSVASVLSAPVKVRRDVVFALMTVPAANHAFFLWQAACREATQGEGQDYPACVPGTKWSARHDDSYWESGCCDRCGAWIEEG